MTIAQAITDTKAVAASALAAVATPAWYPILKQWSETAAIILPIAGCLWIALQMGLKLHEWLTKK